MVRRNLLVIVLASLVVFSAPGSGGRCFAQDETETADQEFETPLAEEPETVGEYFDAVLLMLRLSRPELAARYLNGLMQLEPSDEDLLALREEHGTGTFLQLTRFDELQPQAGELVDRLTAASLAVINDPAYVDDLMAKLGGSAREKSEAVNELKQLGPHACIPLLRQLNSDDSSIDRDLLIYTLIELGEPAVPPLLGALRGGDDRLRGHVLEILGFVGRKETVLPHLWRPAFSDGEPPAIHVAARRAIARIMYGDVEMVTRIPSFGIPARVERAALEYFRGEVAWETGEDDKVGVWTWDSAAGTVREHRVSPPSASLFTAQQLARDLMQLAPGDEQAQALFLAIVLAGERYAAGWDQPIGSGPGSAHDLALVAGEAAVERALRRALEENSVAAAESALNVLGKIGTRHLLSSTDGEGSVLLESLDSPHERVRFAAASAVMQLDPQQPIRGANRVVDIFARTLNGNPESRTVVIDPNVGRANHVAALIGNLGYQSEIATADRQSRLPVRDRDDRHRRLPPDRRPWRYRTGRAAPEHDPLGTLADNHEPPRRCPDRRRSHRHLRTAGTSRARAASAARLPARRLPARGRPVLRHRPHAQTVPGPGQSAGLDRSTAGRSDCSRRVLAAAYRTGQANERL
ncbi:MAG: hypothetical protein DWQ34_14540 [Planctomycetota bacterium]|nr:MAG: hypothetical protein DWQ34_14540 [Planctomycetota bacterium]